MINLFLILHSSLTNAAPPYSQMVLGSQLSEVQTLKKFAIKNFCLLQNIPWSQIVGFMNILVWRNILLGAAKNIWLAGTSLSFYCLSDGKGANSYLWHWLLILLCRNLHLQLLIFCVKCLFSCLVGRGYTIVNIFQMWISFKGWIFFPEVNISQEWIFFSCAAIFSYWSFALSVFQLPGRERIYNVQIADPADV